MLIMWNNFYAAIVLQLKYIRFYDFFRKYWQVWKLYFVKAVFVFKTQMNISTHGWEIVGLHFGGTWYRVYSCLVNKAIVII